MKMTTQYIKLKNLINKNTQLEVCSQYNNRKVNYSRSIIKVGEPLRIVDTDGMFFSHELVEYIQDCYYGFNVITTRKTWTFEYCDENWNSIKGGLIMDKDELIEKIVDMIFHQVVDLNDPQETIKQIKIQLDKEME